MDDGFFGFDGNLVDNGFFGFDGDLVDDGFFGLMVTWWMGASLASMALGGRWFLWLQWRLGRCGFFGFDGDLVDSGLFGLDSR